MTNSVPDRWLDYKAFGGVIKNTKILAFKVPLKDAIARNLEPEQRFTTTVLRQEFPALKCIIDLTNTCRYYNQKEFTDAAIKYEKIAIPGRKIPTMDLIEKFFKLMDDFISTSNEGDIIGIHCTHGINRTGYLICRYLIQQQGWKFQDSLKAFEEARGYPIERDIYLDSLRNIQHYEKIDTSKIIVMPSKPDFTRKNSPSVKTRLNSSGSRSVGPFPIPPRGFANSGAFSQRFSYAGPPSAVSYPPSILPPPPLMGMPYGHRPYGPRYGVPMHPSRTPKPGFPHPGGFPSCVRDLRRMAGPPRLPSGTCLPPKIPPPLHPPPPPPLPPPPLPPLSPSSRTKFQQKKKHHMRNGIMESRTLNIRDRRKEPIDKRMAHKTHKEQDYTVDTFEENLVTSSSIHPRRLKGRVNRIK